MQRIIFHDRIQAARLLVKKLKEHKITDGIVLAIPRGGVPIGAVVARELNIPLDLLMSKKIGHPFNPELAIGSVTRNDFILDDLGTNFPPAYISAEVKKLQENLVKKYDYLSGGKKPLTWKGKDVIIVDDGLATGNTMLACIEDVRNQNPKSIIVAVPVSSTSAARKIAPHIDQFVCLQVPLNFYAVGEFYEDFSEVSDQMVIDLLTASSKITKPNYTF